MAKKSKKPWRPLVEGTEPRGKASAKPRKVKKRKREIRYESRHATALIRG